MHLPVDLLQNKKFYLNSGRSIKKSIGISDIKFPNSVNPKCIDTFEGHLVVPDVPDVPTSSKGSNRIIEVTYELILTFGVSGVSYDEYLSIPIEIETVPLN